MKKGAVPKPKPHQFVAVHKTNRGLNGGPLYALFPTRSKGYYLKNGWNEYHADGTDVDLSEQVDVDINPPGNRPGPNVDLVAWFKDGNSMNLDNLKDLARQLDINPALKKAELIAAIKSALDATNPPVENV